MVLEIVGFMTAAEYNRLQQETQSLIRRLEDAFETEADHERRVLQRLYSAEQQTENNERILNAIDEQIESSEPIIYVDDDSEDGNHWHYDEVNNIIYETDGESESDEETNTTTHRIESADTIYYTNEEDNDDDDGDREFHERFGSTLYDNHVAHAA
jgi:nitrate/nitrite-specific signal transduction histidine kinase